MKAPQHGVLIQHLLLLTLGFLLLAVRLLLQQQIYRLAPLLGRQPLFTAQLQRLTHLQHPFVLLGRRLFELVDKGVILAVLLGEIPCRPRSVHCW